MAKEHLSRVVATLLLSTAGLAFSDQKKTTCMFVQSWNKLGSVLCLVDSIPHACLRLACSTLLHSSHHQVFVLS
jgi:hypothetical protein